MKDGEGPRPAAYNAFILCHSCPDKNGAPNCTFQAWKTLPSPSETKRQWRTEKARGLRPIVPNIAFWQDQKLYLQMAASRPAKRCPHHSGTGGGPRPAAYTMPNIAVWTNNKLAPNGSFQVPLPLQNSIPVKDGASLCPAVYNAKRRCWQDKMLAPNWSFQGWRMLPRPFQNSMPVRDGAGCALEGQGTKLQAAGCRV